jgi:hypothetical protein
MATDTELYRIALRIAVRKQNCLLVLCMKRLVVKIAYRPEQRCESAVHHLHACAQSKVSAD